MIYIYIYIYSIYKPCLLGITKIWNSGKLPWKIYHSNRKKKHREVSTGSMENPGIIDKYCGCEALHRLIGGLSHYL